MQLRYLRQHHAGRGGLMVTMTMLKSSLEAEAKERAKLARRRRASILLRRTRRRLWRSASKLWKRWLPGPWRHKLPRLTR